MDSKKNQNQNKRQTQASLKYRAESQQIEYKLEKSPAVLNLERLNRGEYEIPRWCLAVLSLSALFLVVCLTASTSLLLVKTRYRLYGESCRAAECISSLGLVCLNRVCSCPEAKHYTNQCVSLSSFGQPCFHTSHCLAGLVCLNSACGCLGSEFWDGRSCRTQLNFNVTCSREQQCLSDSKLECDLSKRVCDCSDTVNYYWNGSHCVRKSSINEYCQSTIGCFDSQSLICQNMSCTCSDTHYWSEKYSKCLRKKQEYEKCIYELDECLPPMFCSAYGECKCRHFHFHNSTKLECTATLLINASCELSSQCRQDLGLECSSYKCQCPENTPIWSIDDSKCFSGLDYEKSCFQNQDCDQNKNLVCKLNRNKNQCGCEKIDGNETFWNGKECSKARNYDEPCKSDIECQTLTQGTYCKNNRCICPQPGGITSAKKCLGCKSGEIYFSDACYYISTTAAKRDEAQIHCAQLEGNLAKVETVSHVQFFASSLLNDYYWVSGRRRNSTYYWLPSSTSIANDRLCPEFSSGTTDNYDYECLYFDSKPTTECFRTSNCNNLYRYVCEIS